MAVTRTPRTSWIAEGMRALAGGGPDAVRVETLAQSLGVTKGGFYWHFEDRQALLDEMLDTWESVVVDQVIERVESEGGHPRSKLRLLFTLAGSSEAAEPLRSELAIRDWARRDKKVAKRLRRVDNRRMDYLRSLFGVFCPDADEVEIRSLMTFSIFVGQHFIAADHGGRSREDVMALALSRLVA